ncbi:hypothetical protein [Acinetobacter rudis]|uniref:Lipoprotein n=1 Tax=Acinetobacter rudis CIP 110305 TaxID=421052 RepID=S3N8G6_9GAMM|nr:hypothetical protein [Acinetobacter rudis]EPF74663.1 hypothetical protein F945_01430 [Acinetobacter rudis CIP 110305]
MSKSFLSLIVVMSLLTGCATTKSIQYPAKGSNTTVSVSSEQISAMTESGGGDHFIDGSQITVGDASNALSNPASGAFGMIGVGIATAIDKKNNGAAISKSNLNQAIKFDDIVSQKITEALQQNSVDNSLKLLARNQKADIKIVPYARISFHDKPNIKIAFSLKSEFKNADDNNQSTKRLYNYISLKKVSLSEWDSNNNELFFAEANKAFTTLAEVLVLDMQHQLNVNEMNETRQKTCKLTNEMSNINFISSPENLCIGVLKTHKGEVLPNFLLVIEQ